jgi:hypothetical protein
MSLFRSSTSRKATVKVLAWGVTNAGKSYLGFSAPAPAVLNWENRRAPGKFANEDFPEMIPGSVRDCLAAFEEIRTGGVPCESVVLDSLQKPYDAIVKRFTVETTNAENGRVSSTVDWQAVNRTMLTVISPLCALPDVNVVAIARQAVKLERNGKDFRSNGIKMVGDLARWEYEFDYILHYAGRGSVEVQKSMSDFLPGGSIIHGDLDWARLIRLIRGEETLPLRVAPRSQRDLGTVAQDVGHRGQSAAQLEALLANLTEAQRATIGELAREKKIQPARLVGIIRSISGGDKPLPAALFGNLVDALEKVAA